MKIINNRWLQLVAFLLVVSAITGGDINGLELPALIVILVITVPAIRRRVGLDRLDCLLKQKKSNIASAKPDLAQQVVASSELNPMTAYDKWSKLKEASEQAGEDFYTTAPVRLAETPVNPGEIDTPIAGLHDWLWDRGYYKEVAGGTWYEMYASESRKPWNPDNLHIDAVDEDGEYCWGSLRLFHGMMLDHYADHGQLTFFVPDDETHYTLDELSDELA